jgi:hypothetical protein
MEDSGTAVLDGVVLGDTAVVRIGVDDEQPIMTPPATMYDAEGHRRRRA